MSAIRMQLEAVGLGPLWRSGDLDEISAEIGRRRSFALADSASARALLLADALTETWRGDFVRAEVLFESIVGEAEVRGETRTAVLALSSLGTIGALRGDRDRSEVAFTAAMALAESADAPELVALVAAMRIGNLELPRWDEVAPELADCRRVGESTGHAELVASVDLAEGWARAAAGRSEESLVLLRQAMESLDAPLDLAVNRLRMAEVLAVDGRLEDARDDALDALDVFAAWGARYWYVRAAMLLASIEDDRAGAPIRRVLAEIPEDPAYLRLVEPACALIVDLGSRPAVRRNGEPVAFLTRHAEAAVQLLAAAGDDGMTAANLTSILWPTAESARVGPRFRTMLWQIRTALGPDAWRLQRRRDVVRLRTTGVEVLGRLHRAAVEASFRD